MGVYADSIKWPLEELQFEVVRYYNHAQSRWRMWPTQAGGSIPGSISLHAEVSPVLCEVAQMGENVGALGEMQGQKGEGSL